MTDPFVISGAMRVQDLLESALGDADGLQGTINITWVPVLSQHWIEIDGLPTITVEYQFDEQIED